MEDKSCHLNPNSYMINMNQTFFPNSTFSFPSALLYHFKQQRAPFRKADSALMGPCSKTPTLTGLW